MSEAQIENVQILFGTDGTGIITTTLVPEPGAMALVLCAIAAWWCSSRGRWAGWA